MVSYLKAESRTHYISNRGVELIKLIKLVKFPTLVCDKTLPVIRITSLENKDK